MERRKTATDMRLHFTGLPVIAGDGLNATAQSYIVWIVTGVLSLGIYPVAESYGLLEQAGVPRTMTPLFLYGAAVLDLAFGVLTLVMQRRARLWLAQIAVIVGYTAIISMRLPEFWLHPYGPILKNLPMLAVLWLLYVIDRGDSRR